MKTALKWMLLKSIMLSITPLVYAQSTGAIMSNTLIFTDHGTPATYAPMSTEHSLLTPGTTVFSQGEAPLWQFGKPYQLPDDHIAEVARVYRMRKAQKQPKEKP